MTRVKQQRPKVKTLKRRLPNREAHNMISEEDDIEVNGPLAEQLQVQDGEAQAADIDVAHINIHSVAVAEQLRQQDYHIASIDSKVVIRQLPSQGLSFQLWPAATTLVTLLDGHRSHPATSPLSALLSAQLGRPLRILELGSGTGLVGIAASAILGAHVTVTDLPHVLPNLRFNVEVNSSVLALHGGSVDVAALSWGDIEDMKVIRGECDLVLGSDVVYHDHLYDPLLQTLRFFLLGGEKRRMVFVMAHMRRWKKESTFFKRAKKHFDVDLIHADAPSNGARVGVQVYRFAAKRNKSAPSS